MGRSVSLLQFRNVQRKRSEEGGCRRMIQLSGDERYGFGVGVAAFG